MGRTLRHTAPDPDPTRDLAVEVVSLGRTVLVEASGELDMATWPLLLGRVTEPPHPRRDRILFDLSGISFTDSEGIRGLMVLRDRLRRDGTAVEFAAPSPAVERVTRLLGVDLRTTPLPGGPHGRASSAARAKTASSISSVRRPVNVFCWLG